MEFQSRISVRFRRTIRAGLMTLAFARDWPPATTIHVARVFRSLIPEAPRSLVRRVPAPGSRSDFPGGCGRCVRSLSNLRHELGVDQSSVGSGSRLVESGNPMGRGAFCVTGWRGSDRLFSFTYGQNSLTWCDGLDGHPSVGCRTIWRQFHAYIIAYCYSYCQWTYCVTLLMSGASDARLAPQASLRRRGMKLVAGAGGHFLGRLASSAD